MLGTEVRAGQVLVVLEAMKMEPHVVAAEDGMVAEIAVAVDDQVERGAVRLRLRAKADRAGELRPPGRAGPAG